MSNVNDSLDMSGVLLEKQGPHMHPLMRFVPTSTGSFDEWFDRWNTTTDSDEQLGLLHALSSGSYWNSRNKIKVVLFLLDLADGYLDKDNFILDRTPRYSSYDPAPEKRLILSQKALSVLCARFFKNEREHGQIQHLWQDMLENDEVFLKVTNFFRIENPYGSYRVRNFKDDYRLEKDRLEQGVIKDFLNDFTHLGWGRSETVMDEKKKRLIKSRPYFIEVLDLIGNLYWFLRRDVELDNPSLEKLREIALRSSLFLPPEKVYDGSSNLRKPCTLEEAAVGGSVAAHVLLVYAVQQRERKRFALLYNESMRALEVTQRQDQLAELEKQRMALVARQRELLGTDKP